MSESMLPAIRDALRAELPWGSHGSLENSQRHSKRLLATIHTDLNPWWHDFHYNFHGAETNSELLSNFRSALKRISALSPEDRALIGTLDLQAMARSALRLGAWRLLNFLLGTLLHSLRSDCPTPQRLSRATGLVAEWALAAGVPQIAILYGHESLSWGSETHRIRSYLAYAQTLDSPHLHNPRDDLNLLLSLEATRCQTELAGRVAFGELHAFRIECLRQSVSDHPVPPVFPAIFSQQHIALNPIINVLAQTASFALLTCANPSSPPTDTSKFLSTLISSGRWRDRILLSLACSQSGCPRLSKNEKAFIASLDDLVDHFDFPPPGPVDKSFLSALPTAIVEASPKQAMRRLLCCI